MHLDGQYVDPPGPGRGGNLPRIPESVLRAVEDPDFPDTAEYLHDVFDVYLRGDEVTLTGQKTYKREVCLPRKDRPDINLEMVRRGYAWSYRQYLKRPYASEYIDAENKARSRKLGLWEQSNPQPSLGMAEGAAKSAYALVNGKGQGLI